MVAKAHGIPFYVAAPFSTIDPTISSGDIIEIEERASEEVTHIAGKAISPAGKGQAFSRNICFLCSYCFYAIYYN